MQVRNLITQLPNATASPLRSRLFPLRRRGVIAALVMAGCADQAPTAVEPTALERSLAGSHHHPGMEAAASGVPSVPGGFAVQPLARGSFPDDVTMMFKIKQDRGTTAPTRVARLSWIRGRATSTSASTEAPARQSSMRPSLTYPLASPQRFRQLRHALPEAAERDSRR